ncbi:uncharacterized protein DUF1702 [Nocardia tenerifensis]|uniref:Uncharacterized protein DUF1702 n=1 Tax=Nocardia tenerifensis TaxID=228006 RepID=A0A318K956_9NOCA|nr:DUF1702 family protein [Nocardia tenerifensis]PXX70616.1 uncharacterized protein DUF1702 [Nocardia tenerifensis]
MVSALGVLRRKIFTPNARQASLKVRGFPARNPHAAACLETAGATFLEGFGVAAERGTAAEAAAVLSEIESNRRGFAFEGAAMALAIRDGLPIGHNHHVADFITAAGEHLYMIYVGVGWALARLPRPLHRAALTGTTDPVLLWLALDGYGFHQAYFHTDRYVKQQYVDSAPPIVTTRHPDYVPHAIDQGIGRALWFVSGADPAAACTMINGFAPDRRADLFAGLGLAATYAGGATESELAALRDQSAAYREHIGQGATFAAEARSRARVVQPGTATALAILTGQRVEDASSLAIETRPAEATIDGRAGFEVWRERIRRRCLTAQPHDPPISSDTETTAKAES